MDDMWIAEGWSAFVIAMAILLASSFAICFCDQSSDEARHGAQLEDTMCIGVQLRPLAKPP